MQTKTIGAFAVKTHLSSLLEEVEQGEQIIITKHGRPVAKLVPITATSKANVCNAIMEMKAFGKRHTLGGLDWKKLRGEGRR